MVSSCCCFDCRLGGGGGRDFRGSRPLELVLVDVFFTSEEVREVRDFVDGLHDESQIQKRTRNDDVSQRSAVCPFQSPSSCSVGPDSGRKRQTVAPSVQRTDVWNPSRFTLRLDRDGPGTTQE